ncbi:alkaline phosphatase family protein [Vibrio rumoiensis]|uniref:Nucleotide pyrophosphatase n=1 Tax=Vibrio rumoiensis 1S-45 TaxID=1188252 RepID=A0A1E5E1T1_9VIBR|nr:alkaline phosphatase family protein [Vibrio rumoiensis]OEF25279.1 nucleotide pyrophosphatase [Vibrio rumoiensis 1S-45]
MKPTIKKRSLSVCIATSVIGFHATTVLADSISKIPVIAPLYYSGTLVKNNILNQFDTTISAGRDVTAFTIAGMTLDAYILTLPLDLETKNRVIQRLSNPFYSIALGHFLYVFYDQYSRADNEDQFRQYLLNNYTADQLARWQHSLFRLDDEKTQITDADQPSDDVERREGFAMNRQFFAMLVSIYDELFNNDDWELAKSLPDHYQYLTNSAKDQATVDHVQSLLMGELAKYAQSMPQGEMRAAMDAILEEGKPANKNKVNNKAQALTITLIDFVRMNVLKAYRQYVQPTQRAEVFTEWMQDKLDSNPDELVRYLQSRQNRPRAVQIVVDGLSQGLMEGLSQSKNSPYLHQALKQDKVFKAFKPSSATGKPEHDPKHQFLNQLVDQGEQDPKYLPFFKRLYQLHENGIASDGISSTPTISVRNLPIVKTGAAVSGKGGTGIPNFHFVDRQQDRAYYFFGNDALQLEPLTEQRGMKTMFDRLGYLKTINCNAQYDWNAQLSFDALVNLGLGESIRDFGEQRCLLELQQRAKVEPIVEQKRLDLINEIQAYQTLSDWRLLTKISQKGVLKDQIKELASLNEQAMPDYLLMYNPWPDHFAHFKGPFGDEIINPTGELNRLDFWLGQLDGVYKQAGISQQTLWGMAGDHGLSAVHYTLSPEAVVFEGLKQEGVELKVLKISSDEGEGPKITNALHFPSNKGVDVVIASTAGGNYMMDFFNSDRGWKVQPLYQELTKFTPISGGKPINMIDEIAYRLRESLDYLVVRKSDCTAEHCAVSVVGYRNGKIRHEVITRMGEHITYLSADKKDEPQLLSVDQFNPYKKPLTSEQVNRKKTLMQTCMSEEGCIAQQWRELTAMSNRPDSVMQLVHLYEDDRAGTVNLFPKDGFGYNTLVPGRHAGETYLEKDAFIGFWKEGMQPKIRLGAVDNGSLAPTLYEYLTGEEVNVGRDGWGYPSLLKLLQK